jgi:hypothetical protein
LAALLIGCNGGESTDTTVPDESAPDTAPSTSVATSTSTTTTSTTTTTSVAPTSTVPIEETLEAALERYHIEQWKCVQSPATCDPGSFAAEQGTARQNLIDGSAEFTDRGWYVGEDLRGAYLRFESYEMDGPDVAVVTACRYDAGTVFGPPGPDGQPTIVADVPESYRASHTLYLENGEWRVGRIQKTEELGEGDLCGG